MEHKLIFLDIDGTLYHHEKGIPKSAIDAIYMAKQNKHKVFVCTGRSRPELFDDILNIDFDGFILSSGAHIKLNDETIFLQSFNEDYLLKIIDILKQGNIIFVLQGISNCYFYSPNSDIPSFCKNNKIGSVKNILEKGKTPLSPISNFNNEQITKILTFSKDEAQIKKLFEPLKENYELLIYGAGETGLIHSELMQKNINKATGIQKVLKYLNKDKKTTFCYGDSKNDLEMIQFCNTGIAMGNAIPQLKDIANDVCDDILQDALFKSFKKHNLI